MPTYDAVLAELRAAVENAETNAEVDSACASAVRKASRWLPEAEKLQFGMELGKIMVEASFGKGRAQTEASLRLGGLWSDAPDD